MKNLTSIFTMTLLAKKLNFLKSGLVILLVPFFFACDDPNALGVELDDDSAKTQVKVIDFTLPVQTVVIDSLLTEGQGGIAVGSVTGDSIVGNLKTIGITEYSSGGEGEA